MRACSSRESSFSATAISMAAIVISMLPSCSGTPNRWSLSGLLSAPIVSAESEASARDIPLLHPCVFGMPGAPSISEVAALVGNPARANVLVALLDGRSLTAGELAYAAGVSPQTTSEHLTKMTEARLLVLTKQGRHSYYRLASPLVGRLRSASLFIQGSRTKE